MRGKKRGSGNNKGQAGGMHALVRQANQVQSKLKLLQEELAEKEYPATAAGGAISVTVKGENTLHAINISDEFFKEGDKDLLESLMVTCVNDALETAKKDHEEQMGQVTGKLNIPGL